jgi:hypothetical protein
MTAAGDQPTSPSHRFPAIGGLPRGTTRDKHTRQSVVGRVSSAIRKVSPPRAAPGRRRHQRLQITSTIREVTTYTRDPDTGSYRQRRGTFRQ